MDIILPIFYTSLAPDTRRALKALSEVSAHIYSRYPHVRSSLVEGLLDDVLKSAESSSYGGVLMPWKADMIHLIAGRGRVEKVDST